MKNLEYFYPLYKEEDRRAYGVLAGVAHKKDYPALIGTESEVNEFLKLMVYSGKTREYRVFRDMIIEEFQKGEVSIQKLLTRGRKIKIPRGVDESWAIFTQDKKLCELLDEFADAKITFVGKVGEKLEFIKRYMLTQLLQDWRGPKLAVAIESLEQKGVEVKELNKLLSLWDFTKIFSK